MPSTSLIAGVEGVAGALGLDILNPLASDWMILDGTTNQPVIIPDTVPRFEYRGESRVSDYPLEQGSFSTYNKVAMPFDIRMVLICSGLNYVQEVVNALGLNFGQKSMQKSDFIDTLDYMKSTTDLFTIVTPDKTYASVNMVHYDYKRESNNGATMLIVEAWFEEIRVTASATYSSSQPAVQSASPSAASPQDVGTWNPKITVKNSDGSPL